jgi:hypothetical protein
MILESSDFEDLKVELPPGLYWLPAHVPDEDVRLLLTALAVGLGGVDIRCVDWSELTAPGMSLDGAVMFAQAPAEAVEFDGAAGCRMLLRRGRARPTPEPPWAEHHIKAPLSAWLRRWTAATSRFSELNLSGFPVALLSSATAEPGEFLSLVEATIEHRARHAAQGDHDTAAWTRSLRWALAQRLIQRLDSIDEALLPNCLEFLLVSAGGELRTTGRVAWSAALVTAGLAWRSGDDLLLSPLARAVRTHELLGPLVYLMPGSVWSTQARARISKSLNQPTGRLRVALICPDFPYQGYRLRPDVLSDVRLLLDDKATEGTEPIADFLEEIIASWRWDPANLPACLQRMPASRLSRFDGMNHVERVAARVLERAAWLNAVTGAQKSALIPAPADAVAPDLIAVDVFFWILGLDRVDLSRLAQPALGALADELRRVGLAVADVDDGLTMAIDAMIGDCMALQRDYRAAVALWASIADEYLEAPVELLLRLLHAHLRMDEAQFPWGDIELEKVPAPLVSLAKLANESLWTGERSKVDGEVDESRAIEAVELWSVDLSEPPSGAGERSRLGPSLVRAWASAVLGLVDEARARLARERSMLEELGDPLLSILATRVEVAVHRGVGRHDEAAASLRELARRETELGLGDSLVGETELALAAADRDAAGIEALRRRLSTAIQRQRTSVSLRRELARLLYLSREPALLDVAGLLAADADEHPGILLESTDVD